MVPPAAYPPQPSPNALPSPPATLLITTCRAQPNSADEHNHVPLAAGRYRTIVVQCTPTVAASTCRCTSCEDGTHFQTLRHVDLPPGDIILVVHGFNCTQQGGISTAYNIRDALIAWGLPLAPAQGENPAELPHLIGFTWPCEHSLFPGYLADKEGVARFAAFSLANLLTDLRHGAPTRRIHIVAHSMGCYLTLKALNMLAVLHHYGSLPLDHLVDEVIWLAPDINADALERSTPGAPRLRTWHHPGHRSPLARLIRTFSRPQTTAEMHRRVTTPLLPVEASPLTAIAPAPSFPDPNLADTILHHPLDGYGYAALDVVRHLTIYTSFNDEALWISPLANRVTEDTGSAAGGIRLGWCGPLHPDLMMLSNPDMRHHGRAVDLVDCTPIVFEHGAYFFHPVTQHDIAARVADAQGRHRGNAASTVGPHQPPLIAPPPERRMLDTWHTGAPLQFPLAGGQMTTGLQLFTLDPAAAASPPLPYAPTRTDAQTPLSRVWHSPLAYVLRAAIRFFRWYYRV